MAAVSYSDDAKINFKFISPSGSYHDSDEVERLLGLMRWQRGYTFIDKALRLVQTEVLVEKAGMRPSATKVLQWIVYLRIAQ